MVLAALTVAEGQVGFESAPMLDLNPSSHWDSVSVNIYVDPEFGLVRRTIGSWVNYGFRNI